MTKMKTEEMKNEKVGDEIVCPNCRKHFIKNSVNHHCCSVKCRAKYYNDNRNRYRKKIEFSLGRKLKEDEIVHHINLDKKDNIISNLWIASNRKAHGIAHGSINKLITPLYKANLIKFNEKKGIYELYGS